MNKKILAALGLGAFALAVGMNLKHAIDNYGILYNNLAVQVVAQDNSSGGDGSGSGSDDGGDSNGGGSSNEGGESTGEGSDNNGSGTSSASDGWTRLRAVTQHYANEVLFKETDITTCRSGGKRSSCSESCQLRRKNDDGTWTDWMPC